MKKYNLFSPFFYKTNIEETSLLQEIYLDKIISNYQANPYHSSDWLAHTSYSGFGNLPNKINWSEGIEYYNQYVNDFIQNYFGQPLNWQIDVTPWYNVYGFNQNGPQHNHIGCDFSAVHYLKFDQNEHFGTTFVNPNSITTAYINKFNPNLSNRLDQENIEHSLYNISYTPKIKEGDFIIFPSHLEHKVFRSQSKTLRIIIAFNISIK